MIDVLPEAARETASFALGDLLLRFESSDSRWLGYLERRYGAFRGEASAEPAFVIRFEPTGAPPPDDLVTPLAAHLEALHFRRSADGFCLETETSTCNVDMRGRRADLSGPVAMYPLDNLLRHLLPLIFDEGIIVHAASLANEAGNGLLACGPSGAGKSTLAELSRGHALSDELSAVAPRGDGATVISLPYWQSRPGRADLRALLFLRQADRHGVEPLRPQDALRRLATQVLWPVWDEAAMKRSFLHATSLLDSVPAFELSFAPRDDVWEFLAKEIL